MRPIWKGSIAFGLVNIPVALTTAVRSEDRVSFKMVRVSDMSPINFKRVAEVDGKEVPYEKIGKAYEYEKGKVVLVTKEDLESVELAAAKSITIETFVDAADVSPLYFHKPYYMEPQKGADRAFVLLRDALISTGKIGIARVVITTRQHLAAVKPQNGALILELMHFADEIVPASELRTPLASLAKKEMDMAKQLVASMAGPWNPEEFADQYTEQVLDIIHRKIKAGGKAVSAKVRPQADAPLDILSVLQKSLEAAGGRPGHPRSFQGLR